MKLDQTIHSDFKQVKASQRTMPVQPEKKDSILEEPRIKPKQCRRIIEKAMEMQGMLDLSSAKSVYDSVYPKYKDGSVAVKNLRKQLVGYLNEVTMERFRRANRDVNPQMNQQ